MVALETPKLEDNWKAPDFSLEGVDGKIYSLADVAGSNGLLVMFICNHCPYVMAILDKIVRDTNELAENGVNAIAIMSNNVEEYTEDSFDNMQDLARERKFGFPYVIDDTQRVARAYGAVCTPDFFGFNRDLKLQYRGRLDDSGMQNKEGAERELFNAMMQIAQLDVGPRVQRPSIGCSIKWN